MYNHSSAIWSVFSTPNNRNPIQLMRFIMTELKRLEWEEVDKLKGIEFKVLLKLKEENIWLKKKEFNCLCKDTKTNPTKAIVDKKFSELAAFFCIIIPTFQIHRGELIL
jgi:hypothetical protein